MNCIILQLIVLSIFFQLGSAFAQRDVDYSVSNNQLHAADKELEISSVISKEGNSILWLQQANGKSTVTEFTISKILGNWNQGKGYGRLMYRLAVEGFDASFMLSGNTSGLTGKFIIRKKGDQSYTYSFNLQSITYQ